MEWVRIEDIFGHEVNDYTTPQLIGERVRIEDIFINKPFERYNRK